METQKDRREFFRIHFSTPLRFKSYSPQESRGGEEHKGTSQNISQSGILFHTKNEPPQLSSILWLDLDFRTLKICEEIENRALIYNNGVLGRVVRVEEAPADNAFDIGVCFLTRDQKNSREVQAILSEIAGD